MKEDQGTSLLVGVLPVFFEHISTVDKMQLDSLMDIIDMAYRCLEMAW